MNPAIKEYIEALEAHISNVHKEVRIKLAIRNSYQRLLRAKSSLSIMESDMLEECEDIYQLKKK